MHEHEQKYTGLVNGSSDRSFGLVFSAIFISVALYPLFSEGSLRTWALGVAGVLGVLALFIPKLLAPANRLWTKVGYLLHRVVSPVALGIIFFLAVLPTGLLMRLFGKDPLRLRLDRAVDSYWIKRDPPGPTAETLNNQF